MYLTDNTLPMRLLGNATEEGSVVEVYNGFNWGRISCESWSIEAAAMVCRHFGYKAALGAISVPIEGDITPPTVLSTDCVFQTTSLLQCNKDIKPESLCSNCNAGVLCSQGRKLMVKSNQLK